MCPSIQVEQRTEAFIPSRVYFEPGALEYPLGKSLYKTFTEMGIEILSTGSHNRVTGIPGKTFQERYIQAKRTMVVGVRKSKEFQTSKPSADYQLPLATGCPGHCQYCYLNTNLGTRGYVRIYANLDEVLEQAEQVILQRKPRITTFDGSCTSDPVPVEPWSGALAETIQFFGQQPYGRFRFVTKFASIDSLLDLPHNGHTRIRFSVNAEHVIREYEKAVPRLRRRLDAVAKVAAAGYPMGLIVGPIMLFEGWEAQYRELFEQIRDRLTTEPVDLTFELITHRFTARAKSIIQDVYPRNTLPMNEAERRFKWGQFGYGKYIYRSETMLVIRQHLEQLVQTYFPLATISYFV